MVISEQITIFFWLQFFRVPPNWSGRGQKGKVVVPNMHMSDTEVLVFSFC